MPSTLLDLGRLSAEFVTSGLNSSPESTCVKPVPSPPDPTYE